MTPTLPFTRMSPELRVALPTGTPIDKLVICFHRFKILASIIIAGKEKNLMANRFKVDCRKYPSDQGCTVVISGALEEVVELGWLTQKCTTRTKMKKKNR